MGGVQSMDILINKFSVENFAARKGSTHKKKKKEKLSIIGLQKINVHTKNIASYKTGVSTICSFVRQRIQNLTNYHILT